MTDILEQLRITPTVTLPQSQGLLPAAAAIRLMMIERTEAANAIEAARTERDELSADLAKLRAATRVRPSKKSVAELKDMLEAMEAMDEKGAAALRILVDLNDKLAAL